MLNGVIWHRKRSPGRDVCIHKKNVMKAVFAHGESKEKKDFMKIQFTNITTDRYIIVQYKECFALQNGISQADFSLNIFCEINIAIFYKGLRRGFMVQGVGSRIQKSRKRIQKRTASGGQWKANGRLKSARVLEQHSLQTHKARPAAAAYSGPLLLSKAQSDPSSFQTLRGLRLGSRDSRAHPD